MIPTIASQLNNTVVQMVNARDLHTFLESRQEFAHWIKGRIDEYGFIENEDFCLINLSSKNGSGGHNKIDYHITINMAKELGMVEKSAKGREIRRYFLEMERIAHARPAPLLRDEMTEILNSDTNNVKLLRSAEAVVKTDYDSITSIWDFCPNIERVSSTQILLQAGLKTTAGNHKRVVTLMRCINEIYGYPVIKRK